MTLLFSSVFVLNYLEMSSPSDFLRKGYNEMIQPLTSTVGLAEHLADRGYVAMDTVDQLNLLEAEQLVGVSKAKDILVNILVSKGTSKVVEIKKCIRAEYSNSPYTSGQSNSPYTCTSGQSNSPYTSGQSNSPYTSGQSNSSTLPVELQETTEPLTNQLVRQNEKMKKQLQEKEVQLKEAEHTRDTYQQSNLRLLQQLQQMQVAKQDAQDQLQEKEVELQEKERKLQQYCEVVHVQRQQFQSQDDYWVVSKDDIIMTREILGEGAYGNVTVAVFRGLRVAAKCLHHLIVSEYNLALFSREMDIASRIRHPNLVQFIGATKVGSPIILTELMSTSLYKELQKKSLTRPQISKIGRDVALALNYLHLWKPDPIIHRDISSPNVLLEPTVGDSYKAKVTDYGTANLQQQARTDMPGNPAYAAPESRYPDEHTPSMDVYSYSVLLMEMTLHCPPCMTVRERDIQASTIQWSPMKSLVQSGMKRDHKCRPTISQILSILEQ